MAYIVDQYFPPINDREESVEFSSFNYWREPVLDIDNCDHLLGSNATPSNLITQNQLPRVQHTPPTPISDELPTIPEKV